MAGKDLNKYLRYLKYCGIIYVLRPEVYILASFIFVCYIVVYSNIDVKINYGQKP
jgi:hypothetical protein